jgi:hypothetical protein
LICIASIAATTGTKLTTLTQAPLLSLAINVALMKQLKAGVYIMKTNVQVHGLEGAKDIANALLSAGNTARHARKGDLILDELSRAHRTEKQNLATLVLPIVLQMASDYATNNYDLRNEAACKMAHKMAAQLSDDDKHVAKYGMPYI